MNEANERWKAEREHFAAEAEARASRADQRFDEIRRYLEKVAKAAEGIVIDPLPDTVVVEVFWRSQRGERTKLGRVIVTNRAEGEIGVLVDIYQDAMSPENLRRWTYQLQVLQTIVASVDFMAGG